VQFRKILAYILLAIGFNQLAWGQAAPSHMGHGGSGDENTCIKAKITRYKPEHLAEISPGGDFSFAVSGSNGAGHIHVSIRQEPVAVVVEDKETFFLVKGKLPENLKNQVVRISVVAKAKNSRCDAEGGWLLKVKE